MLCNYTLKVHSILIDNDEGDSVLNIRKKGQQIIFKTDLWEKYSVLKSIIEEKYRTFAMQSLHVNRSLSMNSLVFLTL